MIFVLKLAHDSLSTMNESSDDKLEQARARVQGNPTDLLFRFELGALLCEQHHYSDAIPELQRACNNPNCRRRARQILVEAYAGAGLHELAELERRKMESEGDNSQDDDDGPPTAPKPAPLRPITPLNLADAKELPDESGHDRGS